ncbi:hypothetical protein P153DRAFT_166525 [Dothidotthia symphoricarpi CBS 119687]|uniref:Uncharacterized protein n=1 Tax=Dothidotthia symphoricarpi CBS 119687 TaxID=1392245 RepID=A0A6A6AKQ7_9PLEO|nr:uncharacterized protein P153DRAFT_166525 [Dothidotthia symphoricarpi CBS 119687]KAF2132542.1 hypothetical protein P153DRAFT_166525 [Dothidotthia symphoricarpi CBS 119687]
MLLVQVLAGLSVATCGLARSLPRKLNARQDPSTTTSAPDAQSTICGDVIAAVDEGFSVFWASDAYNCLISVPFNDAVASRFLKYWNETIQFQSTLAYVKDPPQGYQQPASDVQAGLAQIQQRIDDGSYKNQYDFEADFQLLTYGLHDGHVSLTAGALSAFSFASPYEIASVSIDGVQAPRIYITDDIIQSQNEAWTPSPITTIDGIETVEFLTKYAALNSWGYVEPHAEWNSLMSHPTLDIQGGLTTFAGAGTFYPGENLTFTFENGTEPLETVWIAIYNELANYTGPLTTGGDFYNYFVLGLLPESFDPTKVVPPSFSGDLTEAPTNWTSDSYGAFPDNPSVAQSDLGVLRGGLVTGYFYEDISTGVLSLPSFDAIPDTIGNYSDAVTEFINNASAAGLERIVIDLQRNSGGATLLAYTTFKSFFPDLMPFGGSRRRSFELANVLGSTVSDYWTSLDENNPDDSIFKDELAADEWVITTRINAATGRNFTNWTEYQGPINDHGDTFSLTERYDLANEIFDTAAFDQWIPTMYLPNKTEWGVQERSWNPEQIVLLTDGLCASACSLFVEMMTHAGAKTIVAGGRPTTGPMQAASGNRGAALYSAFDLDDDFTFARSLDEPVTPATNATIPEIRDPGMYIKYASFNLRDQIRANETSPLQFKYEAADCRIYYTLANLYNITRLWYDAVDAAFTTPSLCVQGSTGFTKTNSTSTPPLPSATPPSLSPATLQHSSSTDATPPDGLRNGYGKPIGGNEITLCPSSGVCQDGKSQCKPITITCAGEGQRAVHACLPPCTNRKGSATCPGKCNILQTQESKKVGLERTVNFGEALYSGLCVPSVGTRKLGCARNASP